MLSGLFATPSADDADDEFIRTDTRATPASALATYLESQPFARMLDPGKRAALVRFLAQLEAFQNERILLLAPPFTTLPLAN
jgi:hypothetical protein